jgi:Cu/Ag efflux pump CusA
VSAPALAPRGGRPRPAGTAGIFGIEWGIVPAIRRRLEQEPATAVVFRRIAAPMIGGIFTSFLMELVVYPAIYETWKWHFGLKR